jgi:hypothetical protein
MSLTVVAKKHGLSRASVVRFSREAKAKQEHLQRNKPDGNPVTSIMTGED